MVDRGIMKAYRDLFKWRWKNDHGEEFYLLVFLNASNMNVCMELEHVVDAKTQTKRSGCMTCWK
jgi:hypothetical protein